MKVDLVYLSKHKPSFQWPLGDVYIVPMYTDVVVSNTKDILAKISADWLLFWDANIGIPSIELIRELAEKNVDVYHAGLKLGLQGLPHTLDYINPAWLYNKDAADDIENSSFRLSLRACLVRKSVLESIGGIPKGYWSLDTASLALGYKIIKMGGMLRYHPGLVQHTEEGHSLPLRDEWAFARQFFPKKWQVWLLLNQKGFRRNYKYWKATKEIKYSSLKPTLHSSQVEVDNVYGDKVSVLAPTLDRYPYLQAELDQLSAQKVSPHEVLVTDQTDVAHRQTINAAAYPTLAIKYYPQNEKGQCTAWNKLIEEATGDYLLFLGDDADNIQPWFMQKLLYTAHYYDADMVASNVIELKQPKRTINHYYYMSDTFPITLIRTALVKEAGNMDMFFNKNIRADYDLALRCHEHGAFMIFDSSATIDHHRAPSGGLRAHKARVITNSISKNSITKFAEPTSSEIFLVKKHFNALQYQMFVRIKFFDQLMVKGNLLRKLARAIVFLYKWPSIKRRYKQNLAIADAELKARGIYRY
ncbi:MAG: hypothetical protein BGO70_13365 [Bacteroidetes bacterium 43-93]|nr:glycosyltransferase [Bacteroidota bacterium]OJW99425.1 MAG: hypothetical protein BGO70_13365 [Bacteroidetes bacterium 43-93]